MHVNSLQAYSYVDACHGAKALSVLWTMLYIVFESGRLVRAQTLTQTEHEFLVSRGLEQQKRQSKSVRETYEPSLVKHFHLYYIGKFF